MSSSYSGPYRSRFFNFLSHYSRLVVDQSERGWRYIKFAASGVAQTLLHSAYGLLQATRLVGKPLPSQNTPEAAKLKTQSSQILSESPTATPAAASSNPIVKVLDDALAILEQQSLPSVSKFTSAITHPGEMMRHFSALANRVKTRWNPPVPSDSKTVASVSNDTLDTEHSKIHSLIRAAMDYFFGGIPDPQLHPSDAASPPLHPDTDPHTVGLLPGENHPDVPEVVANLLLNGSANGLPTVNLTFETLLEQSAAKSPPHPLVAAPPEIQPRLTPSTLPATPVFPSTPPIPTPPAKLDSRNVLLVASPSVELQEDAAKSIETIRPGTVAETAPTVSKITNSDTPILVAVDAEAPLNPLSQAASPATPANPAISVIPHAALTALPTPELKTTEIRNLLLVTQSSEKLQTIAPHPLKNQDSEPLKHPATTLPPVTLATQSTLSSTALLPKPQTANSHPESLIPHPQSPIPTPQSPQKQEWEVAATPIGYVKHPLEQALEWLDLTMVWLEGALRQVWKWLRQKWH